MNNVKPGSLLNNRYRISSVLGQGGMGAVYRAVDENLGVSVAVKENLFLTDEYSRQFQREANILASLRHHSLPRVRDYFTLDGLGQYLVMDYVEGEDLRQRIERQGPLPEEETVVIGAHICEALEHLHTRTPPVVHRDIKPGNIKITPDADIVLVDFGLAKVMHQGQATTTGARAMTPGYSPPEQYGTARTDARSDIYSLGATLYAALTGVIPEDSLSRVTGKAQLTPIRSLRPKISRKVAQVIETALEVDPDDRYQTADEMKQALIEAGNVAHLFQESNTVTPPPPGEAEPSIEKKLAPLDIPEEAAVFPRSTSRPRRRKNTFRPVYVVLLIGLLGALGLLGSSLLNPRIQPTRVGQVFSGDASLTPVSSQPDPTATHETAPVIMAQPSATMMPTVTTTSQPPPTPSPTPLGGGFSEIAFSSNRTGNYQIWLMNADGSQQRQLTNLSDGACQPAWSPDGAQIAFISPCNGRRDTYPGATIYIMDANGENINRLPLTPSPGGDFDPVWSPDGKRIAFTSLRNIRPHIFVYEFATNLIVEISSTIYANKHPAWSPSGLQLAFISELPNGQVWLMGDTGQLQAQFSPSGGINNLWPAWSPDGSLIVYCQSSVDNFTPWLVALRYEDRNTNHEFRIPAGQESSVGPVAEPAFSPDGLWIAYESWPFGQNHDIYLMTISGSSQTRLTSDRAWDFGAAWRPTRLDE